MYHKHVLYDTNDTLWYSHYIPASFASIIITCLLQTLYDPQKNITSLKTRCLNSPSLYPQQIPSAACRIPKIFPHLIIWSTTAYYSLFPWTFPISPYISRYTNYTANDICCPCYSKSISNMDVSSNRGTPSSHPLMDFPWSKPSSELGVPPCLKTLIWVCLKIGYIFPNEIAISYRDCLIIFTSGFRGLAYFPIPGKIPYWL